MHKWGRDFSNSRNYQRLTKEQKNHSEFIIETFTDYMYQLAFHYKHGFCCEQSDVNFYQQLLKSADSGYVPAKYEVIRCRFMV